MSQVQSVDEVFSCDVVIRPATTSSFQESQGHTVSKSTTEFLESLGVDLQTFQEQPLVYAMNERALFDPTYNAETDAGFDVSAVLSTLDGHSAEGATALETLTFS
jgi:hypothetical protein